jgi:choline/ethanolamine kinase
LYKCQLINADKLKSIKKEPTNCILRLYGQESLDLNSNEIIICSTLNALNIGPKIYGIFPYGRLEEYIESEKFTFDDYFKEENDSKIAKVLASIHNMDMPIDKTTLWAYDRFNTFNDKANQVQCVDETKKDKLNKWKSFNFEEEFKQLK